MTDSSDTWLHRLIAGPLVPVISVLPIPHRFILGQLLADNAREARDGWARLGSPGELGRYWAARGAVHEFARGGAVLDVGCASGHLLAGLDCASYLGVELLPEALANVPDPMPAHARFVVADAHTFEPPEPVDAIVLNECVYYLTDPVAVVRRLSEHVNPGGVVIVSAYDRAWSIRRMLRGIGKELPVVATTRVGSPDGHRWTVLVCRVPERRVAGA